MSLSRISAIFMRQIFLFRGNPVRLVSIFLWLVIDVIQWGFISKYLGSFGQATFNFVTVILGAIILWEFMARVQQGIMMAFLEDIWTQNFINFFASPLKIREYLCGLVMTSVATSLAAFLIMVVLAGAAFGYDMLKIGLFLVPSMLILLIFGIGMGIFVSGVVFRLGPSAEWLGWPIPLVLSIFAGVYYPLSALPPALRAFARLVPPSYVVQSLRTILASGTFPAHLAADLLVGALLSILYLIGASYFFAAIYRRNLKSGSIARFNAEAL